MTVNDADLEIVKEQLGRAPRGVLDIAYRTPDNQPAVVKTSQNYLTARHFLPSTT